MRAWATTAVLFLSVVDVVSPFSLAPRPFHSSSRNWTPESCVRGLRRPQPAPLLRQGGCTLCSSTSESTETSSGVLLVQKPVADEQEVLRAQKPTRPVLRRELVDSIFVSMDINGDKAISREEFIDAFPEVDSSVMENAANELFVEDGSELSDDAFYAWACAGGELASELVSKVVRDQAMTLFNEIDTDKSGDVDAEELRALAFSMGMKWSAKQAEDVFKTIDRDGTGSIDFEEFFAWYFEQSNAADGSLASAAGAQLRLMLRRSEVADSRRILVKGVPLKANEDVVRRFFRDCGEIQEVRALPWARNGKPSGRFVITLKDGEGVATALKYHRKQMGPRFLEVYRVNQGDQEESIPLDKSLHSAVIGVKGAHLQRMEEESGARVFVQGNETHGWVVLKGTGEERDAVREMIEAEVAGAGAAGIEVESVQIDAAKKGMVIGKGGRTVVRIEAESGAKLEVRDTEEAGKALVVVSGLAGARERAKALLTELLETSGEEVFALPAKFHGTLKGKRGVLVQAVQAEKHTVVQFDAEDGGRVRIRGPKRLRDETWALLEQLRQEVPPVLALLRGGEISAGQLQSKKGFAGAVEEGEMWSWAAEEALYRAKASIRAAAAK